MPKASPPFTDFFDVSIIMPFYKKLDIFSNTLKKNYPYFNRNGIEVIISLDEPSEQEGLLALLTLYPFVNWKVIVNEKPHAWRNPAKAINVGIRHASFRYILVMGPDSELHTDVILTFRNMAFHYSNSFFIGQVTFADENYTITESNKQQLLLLPYGSIFADREHFFTVKGYTESLTEWGGDDDNIRARLEFAGIRAVFVPEAILIHREAGNFGHGSRTRQSLKIPLALKRKIFLPDSSVVNDDQWGTDFDKVIYDYTHNAYAYEQLQTFLAQFPLYALLPGEQFAIKRSIIALIPAYNEEKHIQPLLKHLEGICDGVILLDDGSTDHTYAAADHNNVLLKVSKKRNDCIEELTNRNLLLTLASFFQCDWLFFIDADERFDERFADLYTAAKQADADSICFYLVHLWNSENKFRTNLPEGSPIGAPGIIHRWRMFRKRGYLQISYPSKIHVPAIPYKSRKYLAPVLIKHYGLIDDSIRRHKLHLYETEDDMLPAQPHKYKYFNDQQIALCDLSEIRSLPAILY